MDSLQTFLFDDADIRGAIVRLDKRFSELVNGSPYSAQQRQLLADFVVATLLIASNLKFDGLISLQARGNDGVILMAESRNNLAFRGVIEGDSDHWDFASLFRGGVLAITLEPEKGRRYQGMVPLEADNLSDCLADYFLQSEQLPSRFYLFQQSGQVAGLMLQGLPKQVCLDDEQRIENWRRVTQLASTLKAHEILENDFDTILYRLYHEERVRLFDSHKVTFKCQCSTERMERGLLSLGEVALLELLEDVGDVDTECHFCHRNYHFSKAEVILLLSGRQSSH